MSLSAVAFDPVSSSSLVNEVMERSNQNLLSCYQCRRCASGCTVGEETGITPDKVIRLIITGQREQAIDNALVWQCVSCYTCGTRCPNNIQSGRITETLKKMSKEEKFIPLSPNIAFFHDAFIHGCTRWGRVNEIEFMGFYELKSIAKHMVGFRFKKVKQEIIEQIRLGYSMVRQKRLHLRLHTSKGRKEVKNLYKTAMQKKEKRIQDKHNKTVSYN